MNVQQSKETEQIPIEQQQALKVEPKSGKAEATEMSGQQVQESKKESCEVCDLAGIRVNEKDLELKDYTCTLKIDEKMNHSQRYLIGNLFVEFANISNPDQLREKKDLPSWPLEHPWYSEGHVPLQEKRTFRFKALMDIFCDYLFRFDQLKSCEGRVGIIDYATIIDEKVSTFVLERKKQGSSTESTLQSKQSEPKMHTMSGEQSSHGTQQTNVKEGEEQQVKKDWKEGQQQQK